MTKVLTTQSLTKNFGYIQAVNNLSLEIEKGSIFGILGPNGSGKTTTLSIILDITPADNGTYQWFEEGTSHLLRKKIGSLLETPNFYEYLSAERNLKITADIKNVPYNDIDRVLQIVDLLPRKKDQFSNYSLGMKQRLAIASALLGNPEVLLLDEPTNGLDPEGIAEIRDLIVKVAQEGVTVILASHMLDEVEKVCSHVAIIKKGKLLVQGRVDEILGDENIIEIKAGNMDTLKEAIKEFPDIVSAKREMDKFILKLSEGISNEDINKHFFEKGITLSHLVSKKKNLEKQFLEITKE